MTDTTKPPDLEFEPGIDVERDSAKEIRIEANGQEIPSETYHVVHDWSGDRSLSTTVIHAVQRVLNTPEEELPILYEHIDPDALDRLLLLSNQIEGAPTDESPSRMLDYA